MDKRTVAVLFGGCSSEYSVSLASAQAVSIWIGSAIRLC